MEIYGRKIAHIISSIIIIIGWACIAIANSLLPILIGRALQGVSLGMSSSLGPILIAEYASPKNRGVFLSSVSFFLALQTLIIQTVGSYITWQMTSTLCIVISIINLTIIAASPESPSWLAARGRNEDCRKAFHWLRGHNENEELSKLLAACSAGGLISNNREVNSYHKNLKNKLIYFKSSIVKKEFYKPIIISFHIFVVEEWSGVNLLCLYVQYVIEGLIGSEIINAPLLIFTVNAQRVITTVLAIYLIKKIKRRTMLLFTSIMCIFIHLITAGYSYARVSNLLPFDSPFIGILLIHLHMFTVAIGSLPLPTIIAGEIFSLKYRSLSSAITSLFVCFHVFLCIKTFFYLHRNLRLYGVYIFYVCVITYALIVIWSLLPETKDKTLQDIEEEFKERSVKREDVLSAETLVRE